MLLLHRITCEQTNPQVANFCESKLHTHNMEAKRAQHINIVGEQNTRTIYKQS